MIEIYNIDYDKYVDLIGTAHFTRRSLNDAYEAIETRKPTDVAIELDWGRFRYLNAACLNCPRRGLCKGICEFTGAAEALGNMDANIWLIDMSEQEIRQRVRMRMTPFERAHMGFPAYIYEQEDPVWLWERGFKDRVVENSKRRIEVLKRTSPSVWGVLIDERNALMSARLAWIVTKNLDERKDSKVLAFVGAAHVEGIRELLRSPLRMKEELGKFGLSFTEPTLIRRVAVQAN